MVGYSPDFPTDYSCLIASGVGLVRHFLTLFDKPIFQEEQVCFRQILPAIPQICGMSRHGACYGFQQQIRLKPNASNLKIKWVPERAKEKPKGDNSF